VARVPKVTLMVKCKVNGKWKNLPVQFSANGRLKAIAGGTFYLRHSRNQWEPVGKDPDVALAAKRRREIALEGIAGVSVAGALQEQRNSQRRIDYAIEQYLADTQAQKELRTFGAYKIAIAQFHESCTS
jgi:hypothetical protein